MKETSKQENNPHFLRGKKPKPSQIRHPYYSRTLILLTLAFAIRDILEISQYNLEVI